MFISHLTQDGASGSQLNVKFMLRHFMHEHEWPKKRRTSVRGDKCVEMRGAVSGINTRWDTHPSDGF